LFSEKVKGLKPPDNSNVILFPNKNSTPMLGVVVAQYGKFVFIPTLCEKAKEE
jgi:hypothetical protein